MRDGKKARGGRPLSGRQADAARQDARGRESRKAGGRQADAARPDARKQGGRRAGGRQREALKPDARELEARRVAALASAAQAGAEAEQADELLKMEILMRKDRNKVRRKYALMVFALFVFASALIYRYTYVIELSGMISRQNATLAKIDGENSVLQKQISMETDLEKIRLLAESRLNMHKPEKHQ
ncbi:MAG: hypothetical protein LBJ10_00900, partial [Clostridiales bacterium]|nr:hypothetical protein [Clostridiales bacterium]